MAAPKWAAALLRRVAPPGRADDVLGDLEEAHRKRIERHGRAFGNLLTAVEAVDVAFSLMRERLRERRAAGRPAVPITEPRRHSWTIGMSLLDFKLGFRMLVKYPGLSVVGVFAMSVGIAIAAGYFEFANDLINPNLPFQDGHRIVAIQNWDAAMASSERRSIHDFATWRDELELVEDLGAFTAFRRNVITEDGRAEPVRGSQISASAFRLVRVPPLLGRPLVEADEQGGAPAVVVIGYDLWQARFGADSGIVGRSIQLGSSRSTVVGVMPEGFLFPWHDNLWVPLRVNLLDYERLEGPGIVVFGRLAPGATLEEAQAELTSIGLRAAADFPDTNEHLLPRILPYAKSLFNDGIVLPVYGIQSLLLMILGVACVNVATLVFARTATREGEITVRNALGASRGRIVMQLFVEALVLASIAAIVGLAAASLGLRQVLHLVTTAFGPLPFWWNQSLAPATIFFVGILAVLSATIAGVVPAIKVTGRRAQEGLRHVAMGGSGMRFGGLSSAVIVTQVAFSVGLLTFALSEGWETFRVQATEVGFSAEEYLSVRVQMDREIPPSAHADTYQAEFSSRYREIYEEVARRVASEPGISAVTYADMLPGLSHPHRFVEVDGVEPPGGSAIGHSVRNARVDPGFFDVLNTPILSGRGFAFGDAEADRDVVIVNQSFVSQILGDQNPIGRRVRYAAPPDEQLGPWYEIVGVVGDLWMHPENPNAAGLYRPASPGDVYPLRMVVHVRQDPLSFAPRLRRIATAVDPTLRLDELRPLDEIVRLARVIASFIALVIALVAAMVLVLATVGTYALMSFIVSQRTREIGIRTALGANPRRIIAEIFSRGLAQLGAGVVLGIVGLVILDGFESETVAPGVALVVPALMMVAGLLACAVPARRALQVQPTEALREGG